ncbi:PSD1 and planctomycete cytochrome C domain-containing protein [Luteolibacter arcticus]|uniref:PSD1 and planctomycete cytochrome C domain-containing protein n=1 Tax=Luteolibacter arcticus TaxID=1581411 RepID=A0ABT3GK36_9BACT|nr:PSD1 and planctomycete cytochrome C domain-containing protein [Luteolibacter arcticus]MCW1923883.1 PSD1 and planctomycete cytochrome C domain-containing protein [Luteolibacter arcticus]
MFRSSRSIFLLPVFFLALAGGGGKLQAATPVLPEQVTFNAHIRPIFSNTCFACHGFDKSHRKADLRLDIPEGAYAKLKDSEEHAIVPGKPDESAIWRHIISKDPKQVMPPPEFHKDLTELQKQLIRRWIQQGAKYEQHWAFAPVVKAAAPALTKHAEAVANPIDAFVLAKLETEKLDPSPEADKATLLRRLSLDLIGLPPTPAEVAAFLADQSPDAYAKQVERLLASPHYGERMAVPWLDVVRFADTVGYHGDQNQRIYPYRDYVINAFNDNKPFDQFTTEQLAGDLLPSATDEQRIATGFLRLNLMTREGGAQEKEYLAKYAGDRVRAIGAAWLGLTTGCAECHDHKFDPLTAKDFYSLGAFFDDVRQWGVYSNQSYSTTKDLVGFDNTSPFPPEIHAPNAAIRKRLLTLQEDGVATLSASGTADGPAFQLWKQRAASFVSAHPTGWAVLEPREVSPAKKTPHEVQQDQSILFTGPPVKDEVITLKLELPDVAVRSLRLEVLPDARNAGKIGRQANGKFTVTPTFAIDATPLKIAWSQADRRTPAKYTEGNPSPLLEPKWTSAPAPFEEPLDAASRPHHALYHLAETQPATRGRLLTITLATADIGRVRISITPFGDAVPGLTNALRGELAVALKSPPNALTDTQRRELVAGWLQSTTPDAKLPAAYRTIRDAIVKCRAGYAWSLVAQSLSADKIRKSHILPRGNWAAPAEEVLPAVPAFLPQASLAGKTGRLTRLDLATWLTAADNPLPARQFANRLWKQFFGKGLSNVLDDLGNQGEWPSHPQLLDWLAAEFRDSGWDVKHVVRLIVTSRTYRQRSAGRPELADRDPANRLLCEQSPRRLDAEFVRDNVLSISGLLEDDLIGGPSAKPYQPAGYYANLNFPQRDYAADTGDQQYRRGLYMHWQRTFMHPMLAGFDAPSREECAADRLQSNSPQQALILLNDPSFVEAARSFALRLLAEHAAAGDEERVRAAIRTALGRDAKPAELKSLTAFLAQQRDDYAAKPEDAVAFLKIGLSDHGESHPPAELAAWAQVCRVILNLHETLTRY